MNAYDVITDRIIAQLEKGNVPWHKPWNAGGPPRNLISQKPYRGINVWMLACQGYASPYWLTYKQAKDIGGHVKAGEKGCPVVFWKELDIQDTDPETGQAETKTIPMMRYSTVFNVAQCELPCQLQAKLSAKENRVPSDPIPACEILVAGMPSPPVIEHGKARASYVSKTDSVEMPDADRFESRQAYYAVLLHELTHATGHGTRLDRPGVNSAEPITFGSATYSREELIAEMGAAYLCGTVGILDRVFDNTVAYCQHWIKRLKDDSKLIVQAASAAQKAADYILVRQTKVRT